MAPLSSGLSRIVLLVSVLMPGCTLVVSPPEGKQTCRFDVSNTLCGACIVDNCQDAVDDCCGDERCRDLLAGIEDCARKADDSCEAFKQLSEGEAAGSSLSRCVQTACPGRCESVGTSDTYCLDILTAGKTACSCRYGEGSNPLVCSSLEYPDTMCCAPQGWPAPGQQCSCKPIGCQPTPDGCICTLIDYKGADTSRSCEGVHCCAGNDACVCGSTPCPSHLTPVERCSLDVLTCPKQQSRLPSCSVHEP